MPYISGIDLYVINWCAYKVGLYFSSPSLFFPCCNMALHLWATLDWILISHVSTLCMVVVVGLIILEHNGG